MKITIDTDTQVLRLDDSDVEHDLYSADAFESLSELWVRVGWALKYSYRYTWMGRPVVQLPEDLIRIQEVIFDVRPTVIVETGVAHGGSLIFYASLLEALGGGRVIGVDIEIRPHNRAAIESHSLAHRITLIEGSSTDPVVVTEVAAGISPEDRVLVLLDSNHSRDHVAAELQAYAPMVSLGSYVIATDGVMKDLHDVPGGAPGWAVDNPTTAALEFAASRSDFEVVEPPLQFDESGVRGRITYWPSAYLRRCE